MSIKMSSLADHGRGYTMPEGRSKRRRRHRVLVTESPLDGAGGLPASMRPLVGTCAGEMVFADGGVQGGPAAPPNACAEYAGPQRRLLAARDIRRGEVVLSEAPVLRWVDPSCAGCVCGWCMRWLQEGGPEQLQQCSGGCGGRVGWCSDECAAAHQASHGPVCALLGHAAAAGPRAEDDSAEAEGAGALPQSAFQQCGAHRCRCLYSNLHLSPLPAAADERDEHAQAVDLLVSLAVGIAGLRIGVGPDAAQTALAQWTESVPLDMVERQTAAAASARLVAALKVNTHRTPHADRSMARMQHAHCWQGRSWHGQAQLLAAEAGQIALPGVAIWPAAGSCCRFIDR